MPPDVPVATYRLQLSAGCGFDAAAELVPYLKALGISHLYASPFLKARPGSAHGYDIVDHNALNPELGGEAAFARLAEALAKANLGLILDFVPNHVGIGAANNIWWRDVLEWGIGSRHAASFDIDWDAPSNRGRVLLPILGRPYGEALEAGEIVLKFAAPEGTFSAWYYQHRLPIRPDLYPLLLRAIAGAAGAQQTVARNHLLQLAEHPVRSREDAAALKQALAGSKAAEVIERGLETYRPKSGDSERVRALHRLLERQHYRAAHWRIASSEINYRRFFDINDLAGLRVEDPDTFEAMHRLVSGLAAEGRLQGLRLDHIDGLADPVEYCRSLRRLITQARGTAEPPFYVVVEKILGEAEPMPRFPGVAGTTGYEWLNVIARLLVDGRGLETLEQYRRQVPGNDGDFAEILLRSKGVVLESMFGGEFETLVRLLARIAAGHWQSRDFTRGALEQTLRRYLLHFPVYRTYVGRAPASAADRATIAQAIEDARVHAPGSGATLDFLQAALTLDLIAPTRAGYSRTRVREFVRKVQQLTGPLMAKSLEDTACYRYLRLIALNEVGGDPAAPALEVGEFHRRMIARAREFPFGMTATATHDTKRGEDARARLMALSELSGEWVEHVKQWNELNECFVGRAAKPSPSPTHRYLLYQALLGAWPLSGPGLDAHFVERMEAYAVKAARESKLETSWLDPDEAYERGLAAFVGNILDRKQSTPFLQSFDTFAQRVALLGALNGLSQLTIKAAIPGVPDFYQGTEFWDFSLVDPDNRRPIDFAGRRAALAALAAEPDWRTLQASWPDGRIKLALTNRLLALRNTHASLRNGDYVPVRIEGEHRDHVVAFARRRGREAVIVAVGRHFCPLTGGGREWPSGTSWRASLVPDGFQSVTSLLGLARSFSSSEIPVADLFATVPVAVLLAVPVSHEHCSRQGDQIRPKKPP
jgi:(1->4)-alpha-D-glucan 1-alpha-D-glucosylmutase